MKRVYLLACVVYKIFADTIYSSITCLMESMRLLSYADGNPAAGCDVRKLLTGNQSRAALGKKGKRN